MSKMRFVIYSGGVRISDEFFLHTLREEAVGLFESLRTYRGKIFRAEQHLARLRESAHTIGWPYLPSHAELMKNIQASLAAFYQDQKQAFQARGESGKFKNFLKESLFIRLTLQAGKIFILIGQKKHSTAIYETGVSLRTSPVRRTFVNAQTAQVKTAAYHNAFLATLEPHGPETYEWIFLDQEGYVTEVRIGNLFIVKNRQLLTPPEPGILNGVTRGVVIECALRNRMTVVERPLTRHEIYNADEAFLTNTSWEMLPIAKLDGRKVGSILPGPITKKLHQTFRVITLEECP